MPKDARRTLLVLADDVDLFAAMRPELDSEMLQVSWARPAEFSDALDRVAPWPWGIAGMGDSVPDADALGDHHVLWWWCGDNPQGLPDSCRHFQRWRALVVDVREHLYRVNVGLRLAPNRGVIDPRGVLILSEHLESLVSAAGPARLPASAVASVARVLDRAGAHVAVVRQNGWARLEGRD